MDLIDLTLYACTPRSARSAYVLLACLVFRFLCVRGDRAYTPLTISSDGWSSQASAVWSSVVSLSYLPSLPCLASQSIDISEFSCKLIKHVWHTFIPRNAVDKCMLVYKSSSAFALKITLWVFWSDRVWLKNFTIVLRCRPSLPFYTHGQGRLCAGW